MTILVPRGAEARAVLRALPPAHVVRTAAGAAAAHAARTLSGGPVLVLGLCGALESLHAGDVAIYRRVSGAEGPFDADPVLVAALRARLPAARLADACSTGHVVTSVRERSELAERYGADVVDMEGAAIAAALAERGIPFAMVRVVSDDATRDLPALDGAIRADGGLDAVRIALAFARRPRAAFGFVHDVRSALRTLTVTAASAASALAPR